MRRLGRGSGGGGNIPIPGCPGIISEIDARNGSRCRGLRALGCLARHSTFTLTVDVRMLRLCKFLGWGGAYAVSRVGVIIPPTTGVKGETEGPGSEEDEGEELAAASTAEVLGGISRDSGSRSEL